LAFSIIRVNIPSLNPFTRSVKLPLCKQILNNCSFSLQVTEFLILRTLSRQGTICRYLPAELYCTECAFIFNLLTALYYADPCCVCCAIQVTTRMWTVQPSLNTLRTVLHRSMLCVLCCTGDYADVDCATITQYTPILFLDKKKGRDRYRDIPPSNG
jgi:hypothetical protein